MKVFLYVVTVAAMVPLTLFALTCMWYMCWNSGFVPAVSWARHTSFESSFWLMLCVGLLLGAGHGRVMKKDSPKE